MTQIITSNQNQYTAPCGPIANLAAVNDLKHYY
jgi:hypothetical protein